MRFPTVRVFIVFILYFSFPAISSQATTYYVAPTGNNSNACTSAGAPCLTITGAIAKVKGGGDIVQVAPGTYNEKVNLNRAGSAGSPVTLRGQDGSGCPTTSVSDPNSPTGFRPNSAAIVTGSISVGASHIVINCFTMSGTSGVVIPYGFTDVVISYNAILGNGTGDGINFPGIGSVSATGFSSNINVNNNFIQQVSSGMWILCNSCTFSENEIFNLQGGEPGSDHDYIDLWGTGTAIRHNYMHGNTCNSCNGYDCHMDCIQTFNTTGNGKEVSQNNTFDRNVCFNHHEGVIVQDNAGNGDVGNWTVTNNVFAYGPYDDGSGHLCSAGTAHPWCWVFEDGKLGTNVFNNNTCISGSMGFRSASGSATFNDNIYFTSGGGTTIYDTSGASVTGSNNLYFAASGTFSKGTYSGDVINKNPAFVSTGTGGATQCIGCNYNIQSTSAAIDAGISTAPSVSVDIVNTPRPQGNNYDIGAYEFTSGTKPQPNPPQNLNGVVH